MWVYYGYLFASLSGHGRNLASRVDSNTSPERKSRRVSLSTRCPSSLTCCDAAHGIVSLSPYAGSSRSTNSTLIPCDFHRCTCQLPTDRWSVRLWLHLKRWWIQWTGSLSVLSVNVTSRWVVPHTAVSNHVHICGHPEVYWSTIPSETSVAVYLKISIQLI